MSISAHRKIKFPGFPTTRIGKGKLCVILTVLLFSSFGTVGQSNTPPVYTWLREINLPTVNVSFTGVNTDDITVSVATDPNGNVYTLSFGKGIAKRNGDGDLINANFIPASKLDGPLDIAIDSEGFIYVANYLPEGDTFIDNGQIRVFSPEGNLVRTILTSFYRPMGLVVDEDRIYVAEFYDGNQGPEPGSVYSRVRIYDKNSGSVFDSTDQVEVPLRIAVDSQKNVYVSQAGYNNNPRVLIFDSDLNFQTSLDNITTPGSIVIDSFDYIHVVEYAGRINFSEFINFENLGPFEAQAIAKKIYDGQRADAFSIKVFSPARTLLITLKDHIDFPLDLTFNNCDRMYVNNAEVFGTPTIFGFLPSKIEFDLEIYKRTPSFDQEKPIITCPISIVETAPTGQNNAIVDFAHPTVTDNCSFTITRTKGSPSGSQFTVGEHIIEFTATDSSGNKDTCSFTITVHPSEEEPDTEAPVITCPQNITRNNDSGTCGAVISYPTPTATDNSGSATITLISGIASGEVFPLGTTKVTFEAVDEAGNKNECSFTVTITDNEKPVITCPADFTKEIPIDQNSVIVDFNKPAPTENCSGVTVTQTKGQASGSQFTVGEHEIKFTAKDTAGNSLVCSFTITVKKEEVDNPPVFDNCSTTTISKNNDPGKCGAIVTFITPTATDDNGTPVVTRKDTGPLSGEFFPVGTYTIVFEASDGVNDPVECSFQVVVTDNEKPVITCPADFTKEIPIDQNSVIVDFNKPAPTENCSGVTVTQTKGQASGSQFTVGEHEIKFTAKDTAGNSLVCSFTITVKKEEVDNPPVFDNCSTTTISKNNDPGKCGAIVTFITPTATDDNGTPVVTRKDTGPLSGEFFPVGTYTIVFEASDGVNDPVECSFQVVVTDNEKPVITCPADFTKEIPIDQNSVIVDFNKPAPTENCSGVTVTQTKGQASGSQFTVGEHEIEFTAKDASGNQIVCSFTITVKKEEVEEPAVFIDCPLEIVKENEPGKCGAVVSFPLPVAQTSEGNVQVTQISGPTSGGFFQVGASTLIFEAKGSDGVAVQCKFNVVVKDVEKPQFTDPCEGIDYTANFPVGEGFVMPDFFEQFGGTDNCDSEVSYVQDPAPGAVINEEGTIPVQLTINDDFGNSNTCSFTVTLTASEDLSLSCNSQYLLQPDENCQYILPDLSEEYIVSPSGAVVTQSIPRGQVLSSDTEIILTATYEEQTLTCGIKIKLVDYIVPVISCMPPQYVPNTPSEGFVLPDYVQQIEYSDNCGIASVFQEPAPGTLITHNQIIKITATDNFGNYVHCIFDVFLSEEEDPLEITCPENQSALLDANCEFLVPDYRSLANVNIPDAVVNQSPPAGASINSSTSIRLTATSGNQSVSCDFQLILEDVTAPAVVCPSDQWENYDPTKDFALPDYRDLAVTLDACGIAQVQQSPSPGIYITQNTTVSLAVTDLSGNSITCAFMVNLTEDEVIQISCPEDQVVQPSENCSFALPDYTGLAGVNFDGAQVTQAPAPGSPISGNTPVILTASFNGQTDSCAFDVYSVDNTAPVAQCILTGSYRLNENGTLTLNAEQINNGSSDNCGIVSMEIDRAQFTTSDIGDHKITLAVKDAAGNIDSCETTISILPYAGTGNEFACKTSVVLELDETGNAVLTSQDLYTGDPQERFFAISKTNFNCSDVGENYINFTYQGNIDSGTCEIKVEVQDNLAPIVQTQNVTITLNDSGRAMISPALINSGTTDNCGEVNFTLNKSSFGCKDLGENLVRLTAVDNNGNSASATAMVTVRGSCNQEPPPGGNGPDEIFIYPNPSPGPFTIATPSGVKIFKVEVFDFRGRFLLSKEFAEDVPAYTMDITGVEQAVYVLKIYTSDGRRIRRVIKY